MIAWLAAVAGLLPAGGTDAIHRSGFEPLASAEAIALAHERSAPLRLAIVESWATTGVVPATLAQLGFANPQPVGTASAAWGDVVLHLHLDAPLDGETLAYAAWRQADYWRWSCGHAPPPLEAALLSNADATSRTTLPDAVLPDACRSAPTNATLVHEAWVASAPVLLGVLEHAISNGSFPGTLADAGLADPSPAGRARLRLMDGVLVATFDAPLAGETLAFAPWTLVEEPIWVCGHAAPPPGAVPQAAATATANTSFDDADLPAPCRAAP